MSDVKKYFVMVDAHSGRAVPDGRAELDILQRVKQWNASKKDKFVTDCIGTTVMFHMYRIMVRRGVLDHTEVQFVYNDLVIDCDKYGMLAQWPEGMDGYIDDLYMELLPDCPQLPENLL